jgi:hypothetical protein
MAPETEVEKDQGLKTAVDLAAMIGRAFGPSRLGVPVLILLALTLLVVTVYLAWWKFLPWTVAYANEVPWRWAFAWFLVMLAAFAPMYVAIGAWAIIAPALQAAGERREKEALGELDRLEARIRGSDDPVDYAVYGRKALNAYYLMGQNQARLSFYIGVAAMLFGFMFLLSGLLVQVLDVTKLPYLRQDSSAEIVTVGGGLIIEFIAATFLWIYRAAIVQLTVYYKRQMLVHSALIAVAVSVKMGDQRQAALLKIIDTMVTPYWEDTAATLPAPSAARASQSATSYNKSPPA